MSYYKNVVILFATLVFIVMGWTYLTSPQKPLSGGLLQGVLGPDVLVVPGSVRDVGASRVVAAPPSVTVDFVDVDLFLSFSNQGGVVRPVRVGLKVFKGSELFDESDDVIVFVNGNEVLTEVQPWTTVKSARLDYGVRDFEPGEYRFIVEWWSADSLIASGSFEYASAV